MSETSQRDYYETLGVPRDADARAIKDTFRNLALKYHPDRNKEPGAEERFKAIAEAYAVLSDPKKRADYDARGHAGVAGFSPEDLFGGINFDDVFGGLGFDFDLGGGGGIFDRFFGRRPETRTRGANLEVGLEIALERVLQGGEETLRLARSVTCPACHGSRAKPGTAPRQCKDCGGSGKKSVHRHDGGFTFHQITPCPACRGQGVIIDQPCPECAGKGRTEREETLTVQIPKGIEDGMALRIPGHGQSSPIPGGIPGDLFVIVRTRPDLRFERRGADLWRVQTIEVADAVLGTSIETPTLDGVVSVTVPPGSQPDQVLRVRGKGLPEFGRSGARGDLYLSLRVRLPERLSREERQLYQRLRELAH
jgi:molecular chaperone DnaJ